MEISVHSGLGGQILPFVTIERDGELDTGCLVTRYIFREYNGGVLTVTHFEHVPYPTVGDEVVVTP